MKRILSIVCAIALAISLFAMPTNTQAATAKYAYMTVEKLTIGQGFIVEPTKVEIGEKTTVADVFKKVMKDNNVEYDAGTDFFYLTKIKNADNEKLNIPDTIANMPSCEYYDYYEGINKTANAPSNDNNTGNADADLDAFDYGPLSGWFFGVNNKGIPVGADSMPVNDQDVIRLQFSLYAYGADIGIADEQYAIAPNLKLANKDELIKRVADAKADKALMANEEAKKAVDNSLKVLANFDASAQDVAAATNVLKKYQSVDDNKVPLAKVKIKKVKNIKTRRVKIKINKVPNATGYIYKYAKNKKFKKAKTKTTKATTIKTKKFKKKQTCYVKVRAYAIKNGVKSFGNWSKVKKVKIKK